ncbi:Uncharacterised protein [Bordetella pertussis]|nr:Uncharacterised protein [Bordetella pertussis]
MRDGPHTPELTKARSNRTPRRASASRLAVRR